MPTEKAYGIQIAKMCEAFADLEKQVELVIPYRKNIISKSIFQYYGVRNNFSVKRLFAPDFYLPAKMDRIAVWLKSFLSAVQLFFYSVSKKEDIVYSRDELPLYLLSFFRAKLFFEAHRFSDSRSMFYRRFKKKNIKIVTISEGLKSEFIKFGFATENILVVHDGVDLREFNISDSSDFCREKVGLPLDKKIIGYVGQLRTMGMEKGIESLIQTYQQLKSEFQDLIMVIVGGSNRDLVTYKAMAVKSNISEQEIIFVGRKEHREIPYYLRAFDILTMPFPYTKHYAFYMSPLKLFEYMASGKPIVASDLPVVREVLNESNALLVEPDNVEKFVEAIKLILANPDLGTALGHRALVDVQDYTWIKRADKIFDFVT